MSLVIFFSTPSVFTVFGLALAMMLILNFIYRKDKKQHRLFFIAWIIFLILNTLGIYCIRLEAVQTRERMALMLNEVTDHLMVPLKDLHFSLPPDVAEDDPEYLEAISLLSAWQEDVEKTAALFTLRKADGGYQFILSPATDINGDGELSGPLEETDPPGSVYPIDDKRAIRDIEAAFNGESLISSAPYRDKWGLWVTAYRPLKDDAGNISAIFAVDYRGELWNETILRAKAWPALFYCLFLFFFFLQLLYFVKQRAEEKNLRHYSSELERIIDATEDIHRHLKLANQNKRIFLENMCGELKIKIRKCFERINEFEALCLGDYAELPLKSDTVLSGIHEKSVDFLTLLDSIHGYLEANTQKITFTQENFHIRRYIENLRTDLHTFLQNRPDISFHINIASDVPERIMVDHARLTTILLELLSTAIRLSENGEITLNVSIWDSAKEKNIIYCNEEDDGTFSSLSGEYFLHDEETPLYDHLSYIRFMMIDAASKIPPGQLLAMFHPFSRRENWIDSSHTTSFGLSMARSQARTAGGRIRLVDYDGPGNMTVFLLPCTIHVVNYLDGEPNPENSSICIPPGPLDGIRVLVVDSNLAKQTYIESILNNAGAATEVAPGGNEAVDILLAERKAGRFFDLVILDVHLAHANGLDSARSIRNHGFMRPIIFIGNSYEKTAFSLAKSDVFLSNPVDRRMLIQAVIRASEGKRRADYWGDNDTSSTTFSGEYGNRLILQNIEEAEAFV